MKRNNSKRQGDKKGQMFLKFVVLLFFGRVLSFPGFLGLAVKASSEVKRMYKSKECTDKTVLLSRTLSE